MADISQALDSLRQGQQSKQKGTSDISSALGSLRAGDKQQGISQANTGSFGQQLIQVPSSAEQKSPLSFIERMGLGFADDTGRENNLKKKFSIVERLPNGKFAVGNNRNEVAPIDPEGIFNDVLGDLADVVSEIPVIAGQIIGATAGGTVGSVVPGAGTAGGIVAGGAGGAAGGEAVRIGIGRLLGVRESSALQEATDIAIVGAFGAAGEGAGQILRFTGRGLSNVAKKSFDKGIKTSTNPSKSLSTLSKVFKVTAAVNPEDTIVAGTYGFEKSLAPKYMNEEFSRNLMTQFTKGIIDKDKALGVAVGEGKRWAKINFGKELVDIEGAGSKLIATLSSPKVGLIDATGKVNRLAFTEASDFKAVKNLTDLYFAKGFEGKLVPRQLPVSQALDFKDRARPLLNKYFKSSGKNVDAERAIAQYLDDINGAVAQKTLPESIAQITPEVIERNPFMKSNRAFAAWKEDIKLLKENGLDVSDTGDLKSLFREGRIVSQKIENFFERFKVKNSSTEESFKIVSEKLPIRFPGGGVNNTVGTLVDELNKFNAAQGFKNASPNFLRLASVAGLMGLNIGRDDPQSAIATGALGLMLATPAGARTIFRTSSAIKRKIVEQAAGKPKGKQFTQKVSAALLSRLLQQATQETSQR